MDYSLYMFMVKKEKNLHKFKFPGESKGGWNNKVLEKLKHQKKCISGNQPVLIWTYARFS